MIYEIKILNKTKEVFTIINASKWVIQNHLTENEKIEFAFELLGDTPCAYKLKLGGKRPKGIKLIECEHNEQFEGALAVMGDYSS